jgi:hypothetical protein
MYTPLAVLHQYNRIPEIYSLGMEAKVTAETMLKFGINNVRGAMFAETRDYTAQDVTALTGFLGHYNQLGYKDVHAKLTLELGPAPRKETRKKKKKKNKVYPNRDACFHCGQPGHWKKECPEIRGALTSDEASL